MISCSKIITFLFVFIYFVLFSFFASPMLTAASVIRFTAYSIALTDRPSTTTSSVLATYSFVLFKIVPIGLISLFLITFSSVQY